MHVECPQLESAFRYIAPPSKASGSSFFAKLVDRLLPTRRTPPTRAFATTAAEFVAAVRANRSSNEARQYEHSFESETDAQHIVPWLGNGDLLRNGTHAALLHGRLVGKAIGVGGGGGGLVGAGMADRRASAFGGGMLSFVGGPMAGQAANFLVSQLDYLRGLDCGARHELHIVCTESFDFDWQQLLRTFGLASGSAEGGAARSATAPTRHNWRSAEKRAGALSEADAAFVRECLYPWDAKLHALVCGEGKRTSV